MEYITAAAAGLIGGILFIVYFGVIFGGLYILERIAKRASRWIDKKLEKWAEEDNQ